jgi:hypothetical protein
MDYKYIEQLLERYWQGNTTLQEEAILRSFYNQLASSEASSDIPDDIRQYQPLFAMEQETPLGEDFDERILQLTEDAEPQRAKMVILVNRLKPLFKAAAIVAILLTLGNAAQAPWNYGWDNPQDEYAKFHQQQADSVNMLNPIQAEADTVIAPKVEETKYYE